MTNHDDPPVEVIAEMENEKVYENYIKPFAQAMQLDIPATRATFQKIFNDN